MQKKYFTDHKGQILSPSTVGPLEAIYSLSNNDSFNNFAEKDRLRILGSTSPDNQNDDFDILLWLFLGNFNEG